MPVLRTERAHCLPNALNPTYRLSGQFPQKFLWDRPELHAGLHAYLRGLNSQNR
jgi:hypothetical protein